MQVPERFTYPSPGFEHYWREGHGRKLIRKLGQAPAQAEIEAQIPRFFEYDAAGDEVVKELYLKLGYKEADALFKQALDHGIDSLTHAPACLQTLFREADRVPAWLNREKAESGAAFCRRTGSLGLIVLRNYSLMGGYESSAINKPLIFTGALKKGAAKRITETTEFWINITGENALERYEPGFKSILKTRLMHAYARVSILQQTEWSSASWGVPVNHGDMAATNLGFSLVFLNGLTNLGYRPTQQEIEGLFHFWKYTGYLLGIPAGYLPDNEEEAIAELYKWTITQPPADEDTKTLAIALMNEPMRAHYLKHSWQRKLVRKIHLAYNYFFLGERSCTSIGLPKSRLRFYPYIIRCIKGLDEIFVKCSPVYYRYTIRRGRRVQEKIRSLIIEMEMSRFSK
ncbi:MAG: oxygenase MpaB family protein [Bacteroidota bacterium]